MSRIALIVALLSSVVFSSIALAAKGNEEQLKEIYKSYITQHYQDALNKLFEFDTEDPKLLNTKYYWQGLCSSRLKRYSEAVKFFEEAYKAGNKSQDIDYEYGQALFATNNLEKARKAFEKSAEKKFKQPVSYYYVGHISQILEEYIPAKSAYEKILKEKDAENSLAQYARFQIGEVILAIAEKKEENKENKEEMPILVEKYVLPQLEKALQMSPDSQNAEDIKRRLDEIKRQYGLDPNFLANGRPINPRRWDLSIGQKISYDNNITQATDLPTIKTTQKESFIFDTDLDFKYNFVAKKKYLITPGLRFIRTKYSDQENSEVYSNDSISITPTLSFKNEHKLFGDLATTLLDTDYNYTARDREANHTLVNYGTTWSATLGERFKLSPYTETTAKIGYKSYTSYIATLNSVTTSPSLTNVIIFPEHGHILMMMWQGDFTKVEDDTQSADTHLFRFDYIVPEFYSAAWSLQMSFALTLTDPKTGKDTRGLEKTYNPGIKITRNVSSNFQVSVSHDYTKKTSLDETTYAYTKNVTVLELRYSF